MPIPEDEFPQTIVKTTRAIPMPAAGALGHYLLVEIEGEPDRRVEIAAEPVTIGRDPRQTIVLADGGVSRLHARVAVADGVAAVEDPGSTNGTFVDGQRITQPAALKDGSVIRIGSHSLRYERRSRAAVERATELERELRQARDYVLSLLPTPITEGAVRADWCFVPCRELGGDAFGYDWLDADTFAFYLLDVAGHGVGAAMHSVAVLNVLRQRALPGVDFSDPAQVLSSLNRRFQMDEHHGLFFTVWYGVYRTADRILIYSGAGHHQAFLVPPRKEAAQPLGMPAVMIGAIPDVDYQNEQTHVTTGSSLYLFSDAIFEQVVQSGRRWTEADVVPLLLQPASSAVPESDRLYQAVRQAAGTKPFDDDASVVVLRFP